MELNKIDTHKIKFDPKDLCFLDNFKGYPEFNPDAWEFDISRKQVLTYIVLMYDPNSELQEKVPNYWQRKRISAELAGFPIFTKGERKGLFSEQEERILLGESDTINRMCIRYCLLFHDVEYLTLVSYMELFIQETMRVMESNGVKDTKAIIGNIDSLNGKIRELTELVFGGRESEDMRKELYRSVISEMLIIRPELISKRLLLQEPPINPVYEYKRS